MYSRKGIEDWFRTGKKTSPSTGLELKSTKLLTVPLVSNLIGALRETKSSRCRAIDVTLGNGLVMKLDDIWSWEHLQQEVISLFLRTPLFFDENFVQLEDNVAFATLETVHAWFPGFDHLIIVQCEWLGNKRIVVNNKNVPLPGVLQSAQFFVEETQQEDLKDLPLATLVIAKQVPMQIFIKLLGGKELTLHLHPTSTIAVIKHQIEEKEGISSEAQKLIYAGRVLQNEMTLTECHLRAESTVHLVFYPGPQAYTQPPSGPMRIFVTLTTGKTLGLDVDAQEDTIASLKERLCDLEGIAPSEQRLIFRGRELNRDSDTLVASGLRDQCTLHLILQLRGGCIKEVKSPLLYGSHNDSIGRHALRDDVPLVPAAAKQICDHFQVPGDLPEFPLLENPSAAFLLRCLELLDKSPRVDKHISFMTEEPCLQQWQKLCGPFDAIVLRRIRASDDILPFHLDTASCKTLRFPLRTRDYEGGEIIFATGSGFVACDKKPSLHTWNIPHGVRAVREGVRDSLFLCDTFGLWDLIPQVEQELSFYEQFDGTKKSLETRLAKTASDERPARLHCESQSRASSSFHRPNSRRNSAVPPIFDG